MSSFGKLVRKSNTSLFWCMQSLPKAKREAIYTLYAYCRHLENIIEGNMPVQEKEELLTAWHEELENIYEKKVPKTNVGRKIYKNCMRFKIKKQDFSEILKSALLDFPKPLQAPDYETLKRFGYGTMEIPLYITLRIIGDLPEEKMRTLASSMGEAMQMTNILKDVKEDALDGHLYMPIEILKECHISDLKPQNAITEANLSCAREKLAKVAEKDFKKTQELLFGLKTKQTRPLKFIYYVYRRYFDIMRRRGWEVISPKPELKLKDKLSIAFKTFLDK